jgi:hypothetical protein
MAVIEQIAAFNLEYSKPNRRYNPANLEINSMKYNKIYRQWVVEGVPSA